MSEELLETQANEIKWYVNIPLCEIKEIIKDNINIASKSFVTIGYYLKNVRDRGLFKENGYSGILEFAQAEFGISKSWASKWMSINDVFSVDGNSPILLKQYRGFSSGKLSEMLYLTEEQREQITISTTTAEIREIKNPVKEKIEVNSFSSTKTEELKNECFIKTQLNNTSENDLKCSGGISEECQACDKLEPTPEPRKDYIYDMTKELAKRIIRENKDYLREDYINKVLMVENSEKWLHGFDGDYISFRFENELFTADFLGDRVEFNKTDTDEFYLTNYFKVAASIQSMWNEVAIEEIREQQARQLTEPKTIDDLELSVRTYNCLKRAGIDTVDELCELTEIEVSEIRNISRKCVDEINLKLSEIGKSLRINERPILNHEPETITEIAEIVNEEAESEKDSIELKKPEPGTIIFDVSGNGKIEKLEVVSKYSSFSEKYFDTKEASGKIYSLSAESKHWHYTKEDAKLDPWYREKQSKAKASKAVNEEPETETGDTDNNQCSECTINNNSDAGIFECHPESGEHKCYISEEEEESEIVEADVIHTKSDPEKYSISDVQWEIRTHANNLDILRKDNTIAPARCKTKMRLDAATVLLDKLQEPAASTESEFIQPELPLFKNNDQRKEWIEAYPTWPLWIDSKDTEERYYRYEFENGEAFVIRVRLHHKYFGWDKGGYSKTETEYNHEEYWIVKAGKLFSDCEASKSTMVDYLKEIQKK